ncbi:MAG: zinc-binding metallopeptidase family protein [Pseudomonadota bacterium]
MNRFDSMSERLRAAWKPHKQPTAPRAYRCRCGRPVFFGNSRCLGCGTALGYEPEQARVLPLEPGPQPHTWQVVGAGGATSSSIYRRCANFDSPAGCNWLVPVDAQGQAPDLCRACRLNRTIPDLSDAHNRLLWGRIEAAKRRLASQLIALGLPVRAKVGEDPAHGLAFDFLRALPGAPVTTGHADGVITLDVEEADDARREQRRTQLHEPYRTLLGHLRHEVGHYYWDRLVMGSPWLEDFRSLFGDERQDYAAALQANYQHGPPADWSRRFVTAYASCHPWEDWAETWAHYLHMVDTVDTALSFGIDADDVELTAEPWGPDALWRPQSPGAEAFLGFLNAWTELTAVLNEMSRSMGQPDFYPFVLPRPAVAKLQFIHLVVQRAGQRPATVDT